MLRPLYNSAGSSNEPAQMDIPKSLNYIQEQVRYATKALFQDIKIGFCCFASSRKTRSSNH